MVNVRAIANRATQSVNPNTSATARVFVGYTTTGSGKQQPSYAPPAPLVLQVQSISKRELEHLAKMNISGASRAAYANMQVAAVDRVTQKGGDILQFENADWLVSAVLEGWTTAGWCKVALTRQLGSLQ